MKKYFYCLLTICWLFIFCNSCFCRSDSDALSSPGKISTIKKSSNKNNRIAHNSIYKTEKHTTYKVVLHLINHKKIKGTAMQFYDSSILITAHDSIGNTISEIVNANNIHTIKIKRKAFVTGMEIGASIGLVTGIGIIAVCSKDTSFGTLDVIVGLILGIPAAVPGAIIGSVTSSIITKRNFKITGDGEKFEAMHSRLKKWKIFLRNKILL